MTNEEAIKELTKFVKLKTTLEPSFLSVAISALEKQIPKKVVYKFDDGEEFFDKYCDCFCPNCDAEGSAINYDTLYGYSYCAKCGQALDWSEYEEKDNEQTN